MEESIVFGKSKKFAIGIVNLYKTLCDEKHEYVLSKQVLKSGTSIGANISEAQCAQSKADFYAKMYIAYKESSETKYWLELLYESDTLSEEEYNSMNNDVSTIIGTIVNIINKVAKK